MGVTAGCERKAQHDCNNVKSLVVEFLHSPLALSGSLETLRLNVGRDVRDPPHPSVRMRATTLSICQLLRLSAASLRCGRGRVGSATSKLLLDLR